jgi:hypothetical protein
MNFNLKTKKFKIKWFGKNNAEFCPNVTFEDDKFKEDNKALNDQREGEMELTLP